MNNNLTFSLSLHKWIEQVKEDGDKILRDFLWEMFHMIVLRTPVDTGFARACWYANIGAIIGGPSPTKGTDGKYVVASVIGQTQVMTAQAISAAKMGEKIYFMNHCAYIVPLEYGHSKQTHQYTPNGMVRSTLAQAERLFEKVMEKHSK